MHAINGLNYSRHVQEVDAKYGIPLFAMIVNCREIEVGRKLKYFAPHFEIHPSYLVFIIMGRF